MGWAATARVARRLPGGLLALGALSSAAAAAPEAGQAEEAALGEDEVIVVTGSRAAETRRAAVVRTEVIDRDAIVRSGAANLAELLEQQPGLQLNRGLRGAQLSMQGMSADHVLVLVDGQRLAGKVDGAIDLSRLSTADVAQVEIVRGPASAMYGADAMGGVINIITQRPDGRPSASGSLALGSGGPRWSGSGPALPLGPASAGQGQGAVQLGAGRFAQRFGVNAQQQSAFDLEPSTRSTNGDGFAQAELSTSARLALAEGSVLQLQASAQRRGAEGVDESGAGALYDRRHRTEALSLGLGPELRLGAASRLRLQAWTSFFRDQYLLDQRGATAGDVYQDTRDRWTELRGQLDAQPRPGHLLSFGLEGAHEALQTDRLAEGSASRLRGAAFAQHLWHPVAAPRVSSAAGLRLDQDTQFGRALSPKLALRFDATGRLALRLAGGLGYKAPDFKDLYVRFANSSANYAVEGNPALGPERSAGVNAAADWAGDRAELGLEAYGQRVTDLIQPALQSAAAPGAPARYSYVNVAEAQTAGALATVALRPSPALRLNAGLTYGWTWDLEAGHPLSDRAPWMATTGGSWERPRSGPALSGRLAWTSARPIYGDDDGDGRDDLSLAPATTNLDLRLAHRWAGGGSVFVSGENLLDAGDSATTPLRPRQLWLGASGAIGRRAASQTEPVGSPISPPPSFSPGLPNRTPE